MQTLSTNPYTIFIGQQVGSEDFYKTLGRVPLERRIEMPVAEELQMGMCLGLALTGKIPVCIFQRMDFLLRAADQIVNHLDKWKELHGRDPHVIIRTTIGSNTPLNVGIQHSSEYVTAFKNLVKFKVLELKNIEDIDNGYKEAIDTHKPIMLIERQELYGKTE
ncbi:MAG: hypothetical protein P9M12_06790 [Candidatus Aceula lacicola]|nr:hypothetical protein [Candidatus Aceula lacicola]